MPNAAADEFDFWGRQIVEHALFTAQALEGPVLKPQAAQLQALLGEAYQKRDLRTFLTLLDRFMAFKRQLLAVQNQRWIGWPFPSLLEHMLKEEAFFLAKLRGRVDPAQEMQFWLEERMGENQVGAHLIDPLETQAVTALNQTADKFKQLLTACRASCAQNVVAASGQVAQEMDRALAGMKPGAPKSVISPVLKDHIRREGQRMVQATQRILGRA